MAEYINREDAIRAVFGFEQYTGIAECPVIFAENELRVIPAADVRENVRGKWIVETLNTPFFGETYKLKCQNCGLSLGIPAKEHIKIENFCCRCGAFMRGEENDAC